MAVLGPVLMVQQATQKRFSRPFMWGQDAVPLAESPYLLHPVETGTAGLYKSPVAILVRAAAPLSVVARALTDLQGCSWGTYQGLLPAMPLSA